MTGGGRDKHHRQSRHFKENAVASRIWLKTYNTSSFLEKSNGPKLVQNKHPGNWRLGDLRMETETRGQMRESVFSFHYGMWVLGIKLMLTSLQGKHLYHTPTPVILITQDGGFEDNVLALELEVRNLSPFFCPVTECSDVQKQPRGKKGCVRIPGDNPSPWTGLETAIHIHSQK